MAGTGSDRKDNTCWLKDALNKMVEPALVLFITGLILPITLHPKTEAYCFCSGSCISRKRWQLLLHPTTSQAHLEVQKKAPVAQQSCPTSMAMGCECTGLCSWQREEIAFAKVNSSQTSINPRTVLVLEAALESRDHASASVSRDWKVAQMNIRNDLILHASSSWKSRHYRNLRQVSELRRGTM